jgi:RecA-family ATPase
MKNQQIEYLEKMHELAGGELKQKQPVSKKLWQRKTLAEIIETDYPPIKWVVDGVIPEGLTKIDGSPKVGKSWLALHLATAVSFGGVFMGCISVGQREVLYLALEDGERRIKERSIKQGGYANSNLFIETPISWKGGIATLRSYLKEFTNTGLIIIDTLFKFTPIEDTNEYSKTYRPISILQEISLEFNVPIVLIHHTRKGGNNNMGEGWADEGMGSQGINGAVDTIILLQKKDGKNEGSMRIKGRDVEEKCYNVSFDRDVCSWVITGESDIVVQGVSEAQAEVLSLLEKSGADGMKTGDIATALGKKDSAISNILKILCARGKIKNTTYGKYAVS